MKAVLGLCGFVLLAIFVQEIQGASKVNDVANNKSKDANNATTAASEQTTTVDPFELCNSKYCPNQKAMCDMPGTGWDNLRNIDRQPVLDLGSRCILTKDGKFSVPDNIVVQIINPMKTEQRSEIIEKATEFTSVTAQAINQQGDDLFSTQGISGSYGYDYNAVKKTLVEEEATLIRMQQRYVAYTITAGPKISLAPEFRKRVVQIGKSLENNNASAARYFSEELVRDFGTHYITEIDIGGAIIKNDAVKTSILFKDNNLKDRNDVIGIASSSFSDFLRSNFRTPVPDAKNESNAYQSARKKQWLEFIGVPSNIKVFDLQEWLNGIQNEPVIIQRQGDAIFNLIRSENFPELETNIVGDIYFNVFNAIRQYYKLNIHLGCTDRNAPNFNYRANMDDNSCQVSKTNYTFGGIFQNCIVVTKDAGDLCDSLRQKNPITNSYSCPEGFRAIRLHKANATKVISDQQCGQECDYTEDTEICGQTCRTVTLVSVSTFWLYWCSPIDETNAPSDNLALFGGLFSDTRPNPATDIFECPLTYRPATIDLNYTLCVGVDDNSKPEFAIPFGGFYSCSVGNPLVGKKFSSRDLDGLSNNGDESGSVDDEQTTLDYQGYFESIIDYSEDYTEAEFISSDNTTAAETAQWKRKCPPGYTPHLLSSNTDCKVYYCVQDIFGTKQLTAAPLLSPPFKSIGSDPLPQPEIHSSKAGRPRFDIEESIEGDKGNTSVVFVQTVSDRNKVVNVIVGTVLAVALLLLVLLTLVIIRRRRMIPENKPLFEGIRKSPGSY